MIKHIAMMASLLVVAGLGCDFNEEVRTQPQGEVSFAIRPSGVHLSGGTTQVTFEAVGGIPPYTWEVEHAAMGTIAGGAFRDHMAVYTRTATSGVNTIRVTDSHNIQSPSERARWTAVATIVQD
jgi:hypothetical protein